MKQTLSVFVSYSSAKKDEDLYKNLEIHLNTLIHDGIISNTYDHKSTSPGRNKRDEFTAQLERSSLILLLLSPDYLKECHHDIERIFQSRKNVIPIVLRPCSWKNNSYLKELQVVPKDSQSISTAKDIDETNLHIMEEIQKAIHLINEDILPLSVESFLEKGKHLLKKKQYEELLFLFQARPESARTEVNARIELLHAQVFYNVGRFNDAKESCKKAIKLDNTLTDAYIYQGLAYYRLERYEKALEALNNVVDPSLAYVYEYKARTLCRLERYSEALANCEDAIKLDDELASAYDTQGWIYYRLKQYQKSLSSCEQALELNQMLANAYFNKGRALYQIRDINDTSAANEVLAAYEQAIHFFYQDIEENKHATYLFRRLAETYDNMAFVYASIHQYEEALHCYDQAIQFYKNFELNLDYVKASRDKADVLIKCERYSDVWKICKDVDIVYAGHKEKAQMNPILAAIHSYAGYAHYKSQHYRKGLEECEKAIQYDYSLANAHRYKADNLDGLEQRKSAKHERRIARELDSQQD